MNYKYSNLDAENPIIEPGELFIISSQKNMFNFCLECSKYITNKGWEIKYLDQENKEHIRIFHIYELLMYNNWDNFLKQK